MNSQRTVVVFGKINQAGLDVLKQAGNYRVIERPDHSADRFDVVRDADAIIVRMTAIDSALLEAAPALQIVSRHGVGYDTVDVDALTSRGVVLTVTGDVNSGAVAEHAMFLMLALAKNGPRYDAAMRAGRFDVRDEFSAIELGGRTLLLVGFGRIGRKVAALATAFGMKITVFDPFADRDAIDRAGYRRHVDLHAALADADVVTVHVPRTPETLNMIGSREFAVMKSGALLINVARGGLVDEAALAVALEEGRIGGAGLDVFEPEPPRADHPLLGRDDVVLSPHCAAFTRECSARMAVGSALNVIHFFNGEVSEDLIINRTAISASHSRS